MSDVVFEAYHKYAPRWVKVIQWRRLGKLWGSTLGITAVSCLYIYAFMFRIHPRRTPMMLYLQQPTTEEERDFIKRNHQRNLLRRDWDIHHYEHGEPPEYDMWERRRKYPEYYAGRYEGDGPRYGDAVQKKKAKE